MYMVYFGFKRLPSMILSAGMLPGRQFERFFSEGL